MAEIIVSTKTRELLTDEERNAIDHERAIYPNSQGVCIEALRIIQKNRGCKLKRRDIFVIWGSEKARSDGKKKATPPKIKGFRFV